MALWANRPLRQPGSAVLRCSNRTATIPPRPATASSPGPPGTVLSWHRAARCPQMWMPLWTSGAGRKTRQVSELERLWTECAEALRLQVSDATWRTWFANLSPVSLDSKRLVLAVPNSIVRDRLESRYRELVTE